MWLVAMLRRDLPAPMVKLNGDGTGTIITGAQENGTGAVMALPVLAPRARAWSPSDFSLLYQDTDAGAVGHGLLRLADDVQQRPSRDRRGRRSPPTSSSTAAADQLEVARDDLELVEGAGASRARPTSPSRSPISPARRRQFHGTGSGDVPEAPRSTPRAASGRLGLESFLAPQLITHAAHVKVDRETGVIARAPVAAAHDSGDILNRSARTARSTAAS